MTNDTDAISRIGQPRPVRLTPAQRRRNDEIFAEIAAEERLLREDTRLLGKLHNSAGAGLRYKKRTKGK